MIEYRPFLNTDPPFLVEVWKRQPTFRGQVPSITRDMLDHHVFSKPYFDREGLILAIDNSAEQPRPLGFVHAGFPPNEFLSDLTPNSGIICHLKTVAGEQQAEVEAGLLSRACDYLAKRGSSEVHAGSQFPYAPFYLGLYGGSRIPGIMADDTSTLEAFTRAGFCSYETIVVMERQLTGFRTIVDRNQISLRRKYVISNDGDPAERSWWESCTLGNTDRDRFTVTSKSSPQECGAVSYWDVEPLATLWGKQARGLYDLHVLPELQRSGLATFLVGESLRHLMQQGTSLVEAQARKSHAASLGVFLKLGFQPVSEGLLMSKPL